VSLTTIETDFREDN